MIQLEMSVPLTTCHICDGRLIPHPLYEKSGTKYCPRDGDFFVQTLRGEKPAVYFDEFEDKGEDKPFKPEIIVDEGRRPGNPGKPILCEQTGVIYPSMKDAAKTLGIWPQEIARQLRGERRFAGGYSFVRFEGDLPEDLALKAMGTPAYSIVCNETGEVYDSIRHAASVLKVSRALIRANLKGYREHVYGKTFTQRGARGDV